MIIFFGYGDDPPLRRAVEAAEQAGIRHLLVDQLDAGGVDLLLEGGPDDGVLSIEGWSIPLGDLTAAYARPLSPVAGRGPDPRLAERGAVLAELVVEWLDTTSARVLNRPVLMASNNSKPFQAQVIARAGFAVPETLISSNPDEVRAFLDRHARVIFKSISGIRSIVRRLDQGYLTRLDRIRTLPTQFQAMVPGTDVRVHVVGERVFATRIDSPATDYRYAGRDGVEATLAATVLPDEVADRCVRLAATLELPLAGIDLRRTPDGEFVCFEVNPMPGYSFFESHTGQPIARAIVDHLAAA